MRKIIDSNMLFSENSIVLLPVFRNSLSQDIDFTEIPFLRWAEIKNFNSKEENVEETNEYLKDITIDDNEAIELLGMSYTDTFFVGDIILNTLNNKITICDRSLSIIASVVNSVEIKMFKENKNINSLSAHNLNINLAKNLRFSSFKYKNLETIPDKIIIESLNNVEILSSFKHELMSINYFHNTILNDDKYLETINKRETMLKNLISNELTIPEHIRIILLEKLSENLNFLYY